MDTLFIIALCTIPFDNLFFAPSRGWATISPILFFIYLVLHWKSIKINKKVLLFLTIIMIWQVILLFIYGFNFDAFIDSLETIALGITFYYALYLRYTVYKNDPNRDGKYLYIAYLLSFIYGLIKLTPLAGMLSILEKRTYARLAFSFTEPSFISLHVFGVLFLFTYLVTDEKLANKMITLGICFLGLSMVKNSSSRCIIDVGVFFILFVVSAIVRYKKYMVRNLLIFILCLACVPLLIKQFPRIGSIINAGIYGDASLASRWFRGNAAIKGLELNPLGLLFGFGIGNIYIPFGDGYSLALSQYRNSYLSEVLGLAGTTNITSLYILPLKMIIEFGLVVFLIASKLLISKKKSIDGFVLVMTIWLYIQFDSYAFYSIWLITFIIVNQRNMNLGTSYFQRINDMIKVRVVGGAKLAEDYFAYIFSYLDIVFNRLSKNVSYCSLSKREVVV